MDPKSKAPETPSLGLSPGARGIVSLLLFIHLFCIGVGMLSNELPSMLEDALRRRVPGLRPYLQTLLMDFSYAFTYTSLPGDTPSPDSHCWIDVELNVPGSTTPLVKTFPPEGIRSRQRLRRYERLAYHAVNWVGNNDWESTFPRNIARQLVAETGATGGKISVRWQELTFNPTEPYVVTGRQTRTAFEAHILVIPGDPPEVDIFKIEKAADVAPPATGP